ncbi:ribonuclease HI family protein [Candidatus Uhrbacteria bacterium]|nr:ribonuclease HI family protein [Candidatus Uhrbacteria bacterium]
MHLTLHTDGGARGNPGPAGCGAVVADAAGKVLKEHGRYLGETTNNQAEYRGLIDGLGHCKELGATTVDVFMDSELIVKQMRHEYKVKAAELAPLFLLAWNLCAGFKKVTFTHIPRARNSHADRLVNEAIDRGLSR